MSRLCCGGILTGIVYAGRCTVGSVRVSDMGEDVAHPLVEMIPNAAKGISSRKAVRLQSVNDVRVIQ